MTLQDLAVVEMHAGYVDSFVRSGWRRGGLAAVAMAVAEMVMYAEDVEEIEEAEQQERYSGDSQTEDAANVQPISWREEHDAA